MMVSYYLVLSMLVLALTEVFAINTCYYSFLPCDNRIIKAIKEFWRREGVPYHPYLIIDILGPYININITGFLPNETDSKVVLDAGNGLLNFTPLSDNGEPISVSSYAVEEDCNGVIRGGPVRGCDPKYDIKYYVIYAKNFIIADYLCGYDKDSIQPTLGNIYVGRNRNRNAANDPEIRRLYQFVSSLGIQFVYNDAAQCQKISQTCT